MKIEYEYGVHCGDKDCYACGTQRYVCKELDRLDTIEDRKEHKSMLSDLEAQDYDVFGGDKI